ncbi:DUF5684 domain-containing protein [Agromyces italicus]|uniref:DUF5684 domain-containing protein n=1 Tax=Agromyces italicus TaxID=279572 RepID=UPI0003B59425|nr:DUF5684 domain-containing protein [Agromyces italicus]
MTPVDSQQLIAATFMTVGFSLLIGIGLYVWYAAMLAKVFARFGQPAWSAWVPVYNEMQLFKIGRQQPWLALLMYLPLVQIVGLVFKVFALHRISTQSWRGVGTTVLGVLLPPVWATVLATGPSPDPELGRMPMRASGTGEIPPVAPGFPGGPLAAPPVAAAPQPAPLIAPFVTAAPVAPPVATPPAATPSAAPATPPVHMSAAAQAWASPLNDAPDAPVPPAPAVPAAPPAGPADSVSSLFAPPSAQPPVAPTAGHEVAAPRVPGRIEPLPPLPPAPAAPVPQAGGAAAAYAALAAPRETPPATAAVPNPGLDAFEPADAPTIVTGEGDDDAFDRTVVVQRRPLVRWRLVLDDGSVLELDAPVVVLGRNPRAALTGEQRLVVPDLSRTLSKTHAVLRLDGEQWSVTDLDSTNGVMVPDAGGVDRLIDPGVPTPVADRLVLGTLAVALERDGQQGAPR